MDETKTVKILKFHPEKCDGSKGCEIACSKVHFKTEDGGGQSAIRIIKKGNSYEMDVCNQCGLCIDICPVGALTRGKNGVVRLDKKICIGCQACVGFCPTGAMKKSELRIEPFKCISCGACVRICPHGALELVEVEIDDVKEIVHYKTGE